MRFLAIDQGGTKTQVVVCNSDGHILGTGSGSGSCWTVSGMDRAINACSEALSKTGYGWCDIDAMCAAMTGTDWPEDYDRLQKEMSGRYPGISIKVENDCEASYFGGSESLNGIGLCAGTGTNLFYTKDNGESGCLGYFARVPHLGRLALNAAIDGYVGNGRRTALTDIACAHYGVVDAEQLVRGFSSGKLRESYAKYMVPSVTETAAFDQAAREVCDEFVTRCAGYINGIINERGLVDKSPDIVVSGGVFKEKTGLLAEMLEKQLTETNSEIHFINAEFEPVAGAMRQILPREALNRFLAEAPSAGLCRIEKR